MLVLEKTAQPVAVVDSALRNVLLDIIDSHRELFGGRTVLCKFIEAFCGKLAELVCLVRVAFEEDLEHSHRLRL